MKTMGLTLSQKVKQARERLDAHTREVVHWHFNPETGCPFWLDYAGKLDFDPRKEIGGYSDLKILGPMCEDDLRRYQIEHFIPKISLDQKSDLILGETAGTTGRPKVTAYRKDEFHAIFVDWFAFIAGKRGFPDQVNCGQPRERCRGSVRCPPSSSLHYEARAGSSAEARGTRPMT